MGSVGEEKAVGEDEEDNEEVEETIESVVEEIEAEAEEMMEVVAEEMIEAEIEEEDDEEDVFPTDEIPSDDVRYNFHTTDGELADDEGMYTDGQNEIPIADNDNEAAEAAAVRGGDDGDGEDNPEDDLVIDSKAVRTAASVAVLDDDLKKVLMTDLRYTKDDIAMMRPDVAADIVRNKLRRPIEGMPPNFYSDPEVAAQRCKPSLLARNKGLILSVAAVGAAALSVGVLKENDSFGDAIEDIADALKGIPKSVVALVVAAKQKISRKGKAEAAEAVATPTSGDVSEEEAETRDEEPSESEEPKEEAKETGGFGGGQNQRMSLKKGLKSIKLKDRSLASIKPGSTPKELKATGYDDTWLDKLITRIGDVFDLIFKAKI